MCSRIPISSKFIFRDSFSGSWNSATISKNETCFVVGPGLQCTDVGSVGPHRCGTAPLLQQSSLPFNCGFLRLGAAGPLPHRTHGRELLGPLHPKPRQGCGFLQPKKALQTGGWLLGPLHPKPRQGCGFLQPKKALQTYRRSVVHTVDITVLTCNVNLIHPTVASRTKASPLLSQQGS